MRIKLASVTLGFPSVEWSLNWHQFLVLDSEGLFSCLKPIKRFLWPLTSHTSVQNAGILFLHYSISICVIINLYTNSGVLWGAYCYIRYHLDDIAL